MRISIVIVSLCAAALVACGPSDPPKPSTPPTPKTDVKPASDTKPVDAKPADAKADEKPHAAESHGMPGMADLFKGDDEKKKDEAKK